ncbi:MAG: mechanosensitive ion channel [Gammaproteobacteria bacterium]|nr:mechanosensitive ion channel [Gammaproteobacteria bacterium]MDE0440705.1 mechanosensitive ion channel [Gammaproteobacteria bacterium]
MLDSINDLGGGALEALTAMWAEVAAFLPNLAAALAILLLGYAVAKVAAFVVRRLLGAVGLDRLSERVGLADLLIRINVHKTASHIMGRLVFWILMLTFLLSASESVGLERLSSTINSLVQYLPRVLGAVFILAIGLFAATFARDAVRGAAESMDSRYAKILGQAAYVLLAVIAAALAIGQLELETQLLTVAIAVVMTAAGVGAALAFGLGAREVAANLLAGVYLRDSYPPGTWIRVAEVIGQVKSIDPLATVLATADDAEVVVPNSTMVRWTVRVTLAPPEADEDALEES